MKNVDLVQFGKYEIDAWYFSPFPLSETINNSKFYFCEFCLWYTSNWEKYNCHCVCLFFECSKWSLNIFRYIIAPLKARRERKFTEMGIWWFSK